MDLGKNCYRDLWVRTGVSTLEDVLVRDFEESLDDWREANFVAMRAYDRPMTQALFGHVSNDSRSRL